MTATASEPAQWACLRIEGDDSRTFLQGQLSNDLDLISEQRGGFFALCTPKGRSLANFFIIQEPAANPDSLLFLVPSSTAQIALDTLAKYIVFSRAELTRSDDWQIKLVDLGEDFPYEQLSVAEPDSAAMASSQNENRCLMRLSESHEAGIMVVRASNSAEDTEIDAGKIANVGLNNNDADLALIRAGIGMIQEQTSDEFVPQMINMQLNHGISFTKGCYTGQEIVARAQYRGKIKRRMYRAACSLDALPAPNTEVLDLNTNKSVGVLISAAHAGDSLTETLLVLSLKEDADHALAIESSKLELLDLPYDELVLP